MAGRDPDQRVRMPVAGQRWADVAFLSWAYPVEVVEALLPGGLDVDQWQGSAWVTYTPFSMLGFHPTGLPPVPPWSDFPEFNLRTYARGPDGRDGLWFLTIDCLRAPVAAAMRLVGLPYHDADMTLERDGDVVRYRSRRRGGGPVVELDVRVGPKLEPGPLDDWLTGRWGAYHPRLGRLWRTPVHHPRWPLRTATVERLDQTVLASVGLPPPVGQPVVHWSPGVAPVRLGPPAHAGRAG